LTFNDHPMDGSNALYLRKDPRTFWNDGLQRCQIANEKDLQDSNEDLLSPEDIKEYQSVVGALIGLRLSQGLTFLMR
jgi:hypothetical protein